MGTSPYGFVYESVRQKSRKQRLTKMLVGIHEDKNNNVISHTMYTKWICVFIVLQKPNSEFVLDQNINRMTIIDFTTEQCFFQISFKFKCL